MRKLSRIFCDDLSDQVKNASVMFVLSTSIVVGSGKAWEPISTLSVRSDYNQI
jgi:hypothetical protein